MNRILLMTVAGLSMIGCSTGDRYDVGRYLNKNEQDSVLTGIIAHVYSAPVYTLMKDRLKPEHRPYYSSLIPRFSIDKYFVGEDGTHYYYIIRPAAREGERRAVGGYFKRGENNELTSFREVFVTPVLKEDELKNRCAFLFDEMVKGTVQPYLKMETYVQWPNAGSVYDTVLYEWKSKLVEH